MLHAIHMEIIVTQEPTNWLQYKGELAITPGNTAMSFDLCIYISHHQCQFQPRIYVKYFSVLYQKESLGHHVIFGMYDFLQ